MSDAKHLTTYAGGALMPRLLPLLDAVFPGIGQTIATASPLGLEWERSTPFVFERDGEIVSHVGVIEMRFVMNGEESDVAIVHGVATHPEHRRRGYYRAAMEEALAWCDERYETIVLNTGNPEYYDAFGFRRVPEHRFVTPWKGPTGTAPALREIDYGNDDDVTCMRQLLAERTAVSERLGVLREDQAFPFNLARTPPHYSADLEALVCLEHEDTSLRIYDVVARRLPSLEDIVERAAGPVARVECYFAPDRFAGSFTSEEHSLFGDSHLMVRGPFPPEREPFMLAAPARC